MTWFGLRAALILDLDGTIRYNRHQPEGFIHAVDDVALFDDVIPRLEAYQQERGDVLLLGMTNQGGVAFGYNTEAEIMAIHDRTQELLGEQRLFGIVTSFMHPKASVERYRGESMNRKPNPGMFALLESQVQRAGYHIDWPNTLFVGDSEDDAECAKRGGVTFRWAWAFFGRAKP